jgi:hypothetical protein
MRNSAAQKRLIPTEKKRRESSSHFLGAKSHCCQKFEFFGLEFNDLFFLKIAKV